MVKRSKGFMSKGTKSTKARKKITVNEFVRPFAVGEKVIVSIRQYFRGLPHPRYNGQMGEVILKRGACYVVRINDGNAKKELILNPVHMKKAGVAK
jgi:ribosomal protein L21E